MSFPIAGVVGGDVWTTATPSVALGSPESCTTSDNTTYVASTHVFWDWTQTFTVQCSPNGSTGWATVTDYTMEWAIGTIVFNTARTNGVNNFVRISAGSYFTATQLDATYSYSVMVECPVKDTTPFQASGGWQQNTALIKSATATIKTYRNDDRIFKELGNLLALQLFLDKANNIRWQFYALPLDPSFTVPATGIEDQTIKFKSVRDVYFMSS